MEGISLRATFSSRGIASILLVVMCVQIVVIEGYGISPVKVAIMALMPFAFLFKTPYFSKALGWGLLYWAWCYFSALFNGDMRFSTIGYLGMFVGAYIVFYNLVHDGAFTLASFRKLLAGLLLAYGIVLVLQQVAMLVGIYNFWPINLNGQYFLSLTKLPSLSLEPSHSARLMAVMMLSYARIIEIEEGVKPSLKRLFEREHRWVTVLFLWAMLTMGSGTAYIALGLLSLYFVTWRNALIVVPVLAVMVAVGSTLGLEQFDRAYNTAVATTTMDNEQITEADVSAASRVRPLINTVTIDLAKEESWIGRGTTNDTTGWWVINSDPIAVVKQYGLIGLIVSLVLAYTCMIRRLLSLETLLYIVLFGFSLGNIAYAWGAMMVFTATRYFQEQSSSGELAVAEDDDGGKEDDE